MTNRRKSEFHQLHATDDVVICREAAAPGSEWWDEDGSCVVASERIELGHKMSIRPVQVGEPVRKYGQVIGFATKAIAAGECVHMHNLGLGKLDHKYEFSTEVPPEPAFIEGRTFQGYLRSDGRAATRNYVGIISTVNCSASSSKLVAKQFDEEILADYANIDGVVPLVHKGGVQAGADAEGVAMSEHCCKYKRRALKFRANMTSMDGEFERQDEDAFRKRIEDLSHEELVDLTACR